jgi:BlaR1 peptidase M56
LNENLPNTEGGTFKILGVIYGLGAVVTLIKLLLGFWKIKRLLNRAERLPMTDFMLMQVSEPIAPFSFFQWVFINLNLIERADLQQIILHEQAHVRERHSLDVVFAEILGVVFWWSPLVYMYAKSLRNVHEYAADEAVLRTSTPPQYGRLLLRQQQSGMSLSLANPFFSQLKKRILMMTRNPSKRRALAKYVLAVPIFLVLTLLLASPKTKIMATTEAATNKAVASIQTFEKSMNTAQDVHNQPIKVNDRPLIVLEKNQEKQVSPQYVAKKDSTDPIFSVVDEMPQYVGGQDKSKIEGIVWLEFVVEKNGSLTNVKVRRDIPPAIDTIQSFNADGTKGGVKIVTNQNTSLSDEAVRVVKTMSKWKAGMQKGVPVRVCNILPMKFKLE